MTVMYKSREVQINEEKLARPSLYVVVVDAVIF